MSLLSRVSVIIQNRRKIVLIHRIKNSQEYYAIPGGGIEDGESPEDAAIREIKEELGFEVSNLKLLDKETRDKRVDYFFFATTSQTKFRVTGPEEKHLDDQDDLFSPQWVDNQTINHKLQIYPNPKKSLELINHYVHS